MKISERWLREWCDPALDTTDLAERFTMAGLEVASVQALDEGLEDIVAARIESVAPHPNADRLRICQVHMGEQERLQIVCGAPNVRAGMLAPLAPVGARLPDGMRIKKSKIRGEVSHGMLCSAAELGLAEDASGLMELPEAIAPGTGLIEALALDDHLLELELTPNRGDCLSVRGLARELAALTGAPVTPLAIEPAPVAREATVRVAVAAPQDCVSYAARIISGVDASAETPLWLREKLRRSGIRTHSLAVDVTNFVMLELGQPMHAFDRPLVQGEITVRRARDGETLELLSEERVVLDPQTLVIADDTGPIALAGIMGGKETAVTASTTDLLLESACFTPRAVAGRARHYKIASEAAHRFERGVDPLLQEQALERATALILELAGGQAGPVTSVRQPHDPVCLPAWRPADANRRLGTEIAAQQMVTMLTSLGCQCEAAGDDAWKVQLPSFRYDLQADEDLCEEIARLYGYDRIEARLPVAALDAGPTQPLEGTARRVSDLLVDRGYQEVITYSFIDVPGAQMFAAADELIALQNPLSGEQSIMRPSLWPGLLATLAYNRRRQQFGTRLFEIGNKFRKIGENIRQDVVISGIISGLRDRQHWSTPDNVNDFYDLKGDVEAVLSLTNHRDARFEAAEVAGLHPGQTAQINLGGRTIGTLGMLHPAGYAGVREKSAVGLFEISLTALGDSPLPRYRGVSIYPAVHRDLALLVPQALPVQAILDVICAQAGALLEDLRVFDLFAGAGIPQGRKSIAVTLTLNDRDATLTDERVEAVLGGILRRLETDLDVHLRDR